jgi:hypothetical protein
MQHAVNERELRDTARVLAVNAAAISDPRRSVGSEYDTEWLASIILLIKYGLIRIAAEKNVNTVGSIAGVQMLPWASAAIPCTLTGPPW